MYSGSKSYPMVLKANGNTICALIVGTKEEMMLRVDGDTVCALTVVNQQFSYIIM